VVKLTNTVSFVARLPQLKLVLEAGRLVLDDGPLEVINVYKDPILAKWTLYQVKDLNELRISKLLFYHVTLFTDNII
jgi:hypothetical protein